MKNIHNPLHRWAAHTLTRIRKALGRGAANNHVTFRPWLWGRR